MEAVTQVLKFTPELEHDDSPPTTVTGVLVGTWPIGNFTSSEFGGKLRVYVIQPIFGGTISDKEYAYIVNVDNVKILKPVTGNAVVVDGRTYVEG